MLQNFRIEIKWAIIYTVIYTPLSITYLLYLFLMRNFFLFFVLIITFSSCDDGDITLESFNFENQIIQKCSDNFLLFKTNNDELLLISIPENVYNATFVASPTNGTPRTITISGNNQIIYRKYSGTVSYNTVCATIPVSSPTVSKEWVATGGTILVETNEVVENNEITAHTHTITLNNVNFTSTDNSFSFVSYNFGNYKINVN
ncbi:conserved hypothetical protein [Flavobacterium sp. 9AF]|uniref:hypothetical protein n=1 Tax=Flavobacterium sp. 9AF TaxID=2653142 RepID=UPI0012F19141|nr:hypothetical protein [Flavobacterium sp. 9AF]VXB74634.1 conserved hypothetical protein [Flavobacterium sp. 9AF]